MNTLKELIENGIGIDTAKMMIESYRKKIGSQNGVYTIKDIDYDFNIRGKIVTLECQECGKVIHRTMISGKNKWSELIKTCDCQKIRKRECEKAESEKNSKDKKEKLFEYACSMIGMEYGDYKIVSLVDKEEKLFFTLECKTCGEKVTALCQSIKDNAKRYKKCTKHYNPIKFDESYIGQKKNFLKVIGITRLPNKHRAFICECDCGNTTVIEPSFWQQGIVKSCGCMQRELLRNAVCVHGNSGDRLYGVWSSMKARCQNYQNPNFINYGGRGISVCEEWSNDFIAFKDWAIREGYDYDAPKGECTIDRIDVNGNYEPSNCRWITIQEQNKNKRPSSEWKKRNGGFEYKGKTYLLSELCEIFNTSEPALRYRILVKGMSLEDALETPKMTKGRPRKEV